MGGGGSGGGSGGGAGRPHSPDLRVQLEHGSARAVAETAVSVLATSHPAIGILYMIYKFAQATYPIVRAGVDEYAETNDGDRALERMAVETVKQTGRAVAGTAVDAVAGAAVDGAASKVNVHVDNNTKEIAKAAVAEVIDEAIDRYE